MLAALAAQRICFRVEVRGPSMEPALRDGDWLLAVRCHRPPAHAVVVARDPRDPSRLLVKRVIRWIGAGAWLEGDNGGQSIDSRSFGPVADRDITGRVVFRYWPRPGVIR